MHLFVENGHASVIEILADKFKASIWERTKDGSTLMHIASNFGHAECATMLFKKGVYLHMPNKRGARSIHTAARYGHIGIINTLIQRGEKVDVTTNVSLSLSITHHDYYSIYKIIKNQVLSLKTLVSKIKGNPIFERRTIIQPFT